MMKGKRQAWAVLLVMALFGIVGMGMVIGRATKPGAPWHVFGYALASLLFGALVGLSEILSRYRDEPLLASTTTSGVAYLLLNGLISLAAFALLCRYADKIFPAIQNDLLLTSIVAGFGGMIIFRSKLFTFRTPEGNEYAVGPAIVLETVLKTIDQKIDRRRATERQMMVFEEMKDLQDFENTARYIRASLPSFQNLTQEQKQEIESVIEDYEQIDWPDLLKCLGLGYAYLNIAGEENFVQVLGNLREFIRATNSHGAASSDGTQAATTTTAGSSLATPPVPPLPSDPGTQ